MKLCFWQYAYLSYCDILFMSFILNPFLSNSIRSFTPSSLLILLMTISMNWAIASWYFKSNLLICSQLSNFVRIIALFKAVSIFAIIRLIFFRYACKLSWHYSISLAGTSIGYVQIATAAFFVSKLLTKSTTLLSISATF